MILYKATTTNPLKKIVDCDWWLIERQNMFSNFFDHIYKNDICILAFTCLRGNAFFAIPQKWSHTIRDNFKDEFC